MPIRVTSGAVARSIDELVRIATGVGWVFVDGRDAAAPVASWPLSSTFGTGDFVVLRSPEVLGSGGGDVVQLLNTGATIQVSIHRLDGGTGLAWDTGTSSPATGATTISDTLKYPGLTDLYTLVYASQRTVAIVKGNPGPLLDDLVVATYLDPVQAGLGPDDAALGSGPWAYPAALIAKFIGVSSVIRSNDAAATMLLSTVTSGSPVEEGESFRSFMITPIYCIVAGSTSAYSPEYSGLAHSGSPRVINVARDVRSGQKWLLVHDLISNSFALPLGTGRDYAVLTYSSTPLP